MTIFWAPLLHTYQPTFQDPVILRKINRECYKPLFSMLQEHDNSAFSLNLNANLIDMLQEFNLTETLEIINHLRSDGKIEVVGTAKFHPILPLIQPKEAKRQIVLNEETHKRFFNKWERNGFFPPELSINSNIIKVVQELGYKWILSSGIACPVNWSFNQIYHSPQGMKLFFRDDILSNKVSFNSIDAKEFVTHLKEMFNNNNGIENSDKYVITAMDSETFGHHHKNYEKKFLGKVLELINKEEEIKLILISELDKIFPSYNNSIIPRDSSWSTTEEDLKDLIAYPLWAHPDNSIHQSYWKMIKAIDHLMKFVSELSHLQEPITRNYIENARWFYDQCICSDTTWWANPDRGIWSPNLIYKGIELIMKTALNAQLALTYAGKYTLGESYYNSIASYHGFLLMQLNTISQNFLEKSIKKLKKKD
jgi:alpha-amylase/alpha-mannosidase (GH57 family)